MTRITLELTAVDDEAAVNMIRYISSSMSTCEPLAPGYGTSGTNGSCECKVTHEDNGIERGMEVTP